MTELRPLLESSDDELELALLGAVRADRPSPEGLRNTALALGLGAGAAQSLAAALPLTSSATTAATSAASGTAGTGGGAAIFAVTAGTVGKSLLGGALISFLALTTIEATLDGSTNRAAPPTKASPPAYVPSQSPPGALPSKMEPVLVEPPVTAPAAPAPGSRRVAQHGPNVATATDSGPPNHAPAKAVFEPVAQPTSAATPTAASLAAETRLLDQARGALAAGDPERASRALDTYSSNRPSAILAQEAALLRVRLLLARGQRPAAAELARRIIAQYPESAHADSLRRLATEP